MSYARNLLAAADALGVEAYRMLRGIEPASIKRTRLEVAWRQYVALRKKTPAGPLTAGEVSHVDPAPMEGADREHARSD